MTEEATAAMTNLELSRELYSEDQRSQFYADYQAARSAEESATDAYLKLDDPRGWKFWQRPTADWKEKREKLLESCRQARMDVKTMEQDHTLLVWLYMHKSRPI